MKKPFMILFAGLLGGFLFGFIGILVGLFATDIFPLARPGFNRDYEFSVAFFFGFGACFGGTFCSLLSSRELRKKSRERVFALSVSLVSFMVLTLSWYILVPFRFVERLSYMYSYGYSMSFFVLVLLGPILIALKAKKNS